MKESPVRAVVFQPATYQGLQRGIHQMVSAVRPTLGPLPRIVAISGVVSSSQPETLDDAGTIARRVIALPERDADMGAMLARELLWRMREEVGDGAATAAVLLQAVYDRGLVYLASGGNAAQLRRGLERGMHAILNALTAMTMPVTGKQKLTQIAESLCYDRHLARLLGEIFDIIGEYGRLDIKPGRGRASEREYVEGMYWDGGLFAREMMEPLNSTTVMENATILISDLKGDDPHDLVPAIEMTVNGGGRALFLIASSLSPNALSLLRSASREPEKFRVIAVKAPTFAGEQAAVLEDMAVLAGGRPLLRAAGHTLAGVTLHDLGAARRVWADTAQFGIVGGKGDPRRLRAHIANLRTLFARTTDAAARASIQARIGKLLGGSATLSIGATTETECAALTQIAERAARALRGARMEGVVPGGGVAFLECRPVLQEMLDRSTDLDEQAAYRLLIKALEEPIRTIIGNAGHDAGEIMGSVRLAGPGYGYDVRAGQVVHMAQAGIFDVASVQKAAIRRAITTAALALSVDVLVHHRKPERLTMAG